jgi:hypothetical protein
MSFTTASLTGDKFTIQVDLSAVRLNGTNTKLELKHLKENQSTMLEAYRSPLMLIRFPDERIYH